LLEDLAADGVKDDGQTLAARHLVDALNHVAGAVVDDFIRAEYVSTKSDRLASSRCSDDSATMQFGELNRDMTDAARSGVDEHCLSRLDARTQMKRLPSGLTHERQSGCRDVIERARFARDTAAIYRDVLRIRSVTKEIRRREDLVTRLPLSRAGAAFHYDSADVVSHGDWKGAIATSLPNLRVDGVDGRRVYFDEHVGVAQVRFRSVFEFEHVRAAVLTNHDCTHILSFNMEC
jgi:hypothetical protein